MDSKLFRYRGIDRFYLQDWSGNFHRQRQLEVSCETRASVAVEDLEKAGFQIAVCKYPMSRFSSLSHVVVYASSFNPECFARPLARLITLGNGRIKNAMFLGNGKVSDKPIDGDEDITLVTSV